MIALEAGLPASGAFAFFAARLALRGEFKREKCNMLQKSLAEMVSCWKYAEIFIWKS